MPENTSNDSLGSLHSNASLPKRSQSLRPTSFPWSDNWDSTDTTIGYQSHPDSDISHAISARALSGDNHVDADKIVNLFHSHYGDSHPFPDVYDSNFWLDLSRNQSEPGGMVSLVAEDENEFIAHLALEYHSNSRTVELLLPAIHPHCKHRMFSILRAFSDRILKTTKRQHWNVVFSNNLTSQPMLQLLAAKCFNLEATALIPLRSIVDCKYGSRVFRDCLVLMLSILCPKKNHTPPIFPPSAHAKFIKSLFAGLGLDRKIKNAQLASLITTSEEDSPNKGKKRSMLLRYKKQFHLFELRISPSFLDDPRIALEKIKRLEQRGTSLILFISLQDPGCPAFCSLLEQLGYRFCGIFPNEGQKDFIAYTRFDNTQLEKLTLYTRQAKKLRHYLLEHTKLT